MDNGGSLEQGPPRIVRESKFPQYAYGLLQAVLLARALGVPAITAAELGVASGNGLLELERLGEVLAEQHGVEIRTVGFDTGSGMPRPLDYRDMPYVWQSGFYEMDEPLLRSLLRTALLLIGDIAATGPAFLESDAAPIGFLAFDLDYYSSTAAAIRALLDAPARSYLPRVSCYFDDTVGPHEEHHSRFTGELLAIDEFNAAHETRKLAKINGLRYKLLPLEEPWVEGTRVLHIFDHPRYTDYVFPDADRQFPLETEYRGRK